MKKLLLTILLIALPMLLQASTPTQASITKLMNVSGFNEQIANISKVSTAMIKAQGGIGEQQLMRIQSVIEEKFGLSIFQNAFIKELSNSDVDQKAVDEVVAFYESDLGQKVAQGNSKATSLEGMQVMMKATPVNNIPRQKILTQIIQTTYPDQMDTQTLQASLSLLDFSYQNLSVNELAKYHDFLQHSKSSQKIMRVAEESISRTQKEQEVGFQRDLMNVLMGK
jgi:hypothetical protein